MKKILFTALLALLATGVGAQEQQKEEEKQLALTTMRDRHYQVLYCILA